MAILNISVILLLTALSFVFIRPFMHAMKVPENIFENAYGYIAACLTEPVIWIVSMTFLIVAFVVKKPLKET